MEIRYIQSAIATFSSIPGASEAVRLGCTEDEIATLAASIRGGHRLPAAYVEFLRYAGRIWGEVFQTKAFSYGVALVYNQSPENSWSRRLFSEQDSPRFPDNVFLFEDGSGDYFMYFKLDEGDDPPVYVWEESMETFYDSRIEAPSFSIYLHVAVGFTKYLAMRRLGMSD